MAGSKKEPTPPQEKVRVSFPLEMDRGGFKRSAQHLVERHHRRSKVQDFLRSGVQLPRNGIELALAEVREVSALRKVLA